MDDPRNIIDLVQRIVTIGGTGDDEVWSAVNDSGGTYLASFTTSKDFPATPESAQQHFGGGRSDAFLSKVAPRGSRVAYVTYLGGDGSEEGRNSVGVDSTGNVYVSGTTQSRNFPGDQRAFQPRYAGGDAPRGQQVSLLHVHRGPQRRDNPAASVGLGGKSLFGWRDHLY